MKAYLIGGGGFSAEVLEAISGSRDHHNLELPGFFDDNAALAGTDVAGLPYLGVIEEFLVRTDAGAGYFIAIGNNAVRERLSERFDSAKRAALTVIHPTAVVSPLAQIGPGSYVGAHSFVGPYVRIGRHVIVNVNVSVGHNATVSDFAQLCPGVRVSGFSEIGRGAFLGSNSVTAPSVRVGNNAKIAASSFVSRHVPDEKLAVGVPAKVVN